ncbi:hypothetical protein L596_010231 [Steinernema carpocapsae]|uniref:Uncharacterized protein n=1 Tax=Steinernema carpocapsae TaxID=34508 RepID=A0A4U5PHR6_STECR|nr:hypothetical protein L596_010231 [Steinernema carpocapsae]
MLVSKGEAPVRQQQQASERAGGRKTKGRKMLQCFVAILSSVERRSPRRSSLVFAFWRKDGGRNKVLRMMSW